MTAVNSSTWPVTRYVLAAGQPAGLTLEALAAVAEDWGADWQPRGDAGSLPGAVTGTLTMPIVAGLRRGVMRLRVEPGAAGNAATAHFDLVVEAAELHLHRAAIAVLSFSALGALAAMLWPFFPGLLALAPAGLVLAIGGWLLVVARLGTSGPEELIAAVVAAAKAGADES